MECQKSVIITLISDDEPPKPVQDGGTIDDEPEPAAEPEPEPPKVELIPYVSETDTVQVSNVTCKATEEQMSVLFSFVGPIVKIEVFPKNDDEMVKNKVNKKFRKNFWKILTIF